MAVSQNGWKANDRSLIASYAVGGGKIAIRKGDVATVLVYVAKRFHSEVENLVWPGNWGYAERPIRGSSTTSNHASGTAIDLNAPRHPLGKQGTFSKSQVPKIRKILNDCGGVVRWGGDYRNRKDEMHFEINAGSARVREVARAIRAGKKPGPSGGASAVGGGKGKKPSSTPKVPAGYRYVKYGDTLRRGTYGDPVGAAQKMLGIKADKMFGPGTEAAVKRFQRAWKLSADGVVGPKTWQALKKHGKD